MYYWYFFEDGYSVCVKGLSENEFAWEVKKHGNLITKERA